MLGRNIRELERGRGRMVRERRNHNRVVSKPMSMGKAVEQAILLSHTEELLRGGKAAAGKTGLGQRVTQYIPSNWAKKMGKTIDKTAKTCKLHYKTRGKVIQTFAAAGTVMEENEKVLTKHWNAGGTGYPPEFKKPKTVSERVIRKFAKIEKKAAKDPILNMAKQNIDRARKMASTVLERFELHEKKRLSAGGKPDQIAWYMSVWAWVRPLKKWAIIGMFLAGLAWAALNFDTLGYFEKFPTFDPTDDSWVGYIWSILGILGQGFRKLARCAAARFGLPWFCDETKEQNANMVWDIMMYGGAVVGCGAGIFAAPFTGGWSIFASAGACTLGGGLIGFTGWGAGGMYWERERVQDQLMTQLKYIGATTVLGMLGLNMQDVMGMAHQAVMSSGKKEADEVVEKVAKRIKKAAPQIEAFRRANEGINKMRYAKYQMAYRAGKTATGFVVMTGLTLAAANIKKGKGALMAAQELAKNSKRLQALGKAEEELEKVNSMDEEELQLRRRKGKPDIKELISNVEEAKSKLTDEDKKLQADSPYMRGLEQNIADMETQYGRLNFGYKQTGAVADTIDSVNRDYNRFAMVPYEAAGALMGHRLDRTQDDWMHGQNQCGLGQMWNAQTNRCEQVFNWRRPQQQPQQQQQREQRGPKQQRPQQRGRKQRPQRRRKQRPQQQQQRGPNQRGPQQQWSQQPQQPQ